MYFMGRIWYKKGGFLLRSWGSPCRTIDAAVTSKPENVHGTTTSAGEMHFEDLEVNECILKKKNVRTPG